MPIFKTGLRSRIKRLIRPTRNPDHGTGTPTPSNLFPNWPTLLENDWESWQVAVEKSKTGPSVLVATSAGGFWPGTIVESTLAVALTLRGANVHILLCDQVLPACIQANVADLPPEELVSGRLRPRVCSWCFEPAAEMYRSLGLVLHRYSDWLSAKERVDAKELSLHLGANEIEGYVQDGLPIGEHALAGALRYFARGNLEQEPLGEPVLRQYLEASLLSTYVARNLIDAHEYRCVVFNHGIYVPFGLIGAVARQRNLHVVNWNPAYRKQCFIFTHDDTYHHALLSEPVSNWEELEWGSELEVELLDYLKSRVTGKQDWVGFFEKPEVELASIAHELGIDFSRPCIGMLTNVMWDAQLHYRSNAFKDMLDWTLHTIQYFAARPELQLVIRVHPGEIRGTIPSRQPLLAEIQKAFPILPSNVFVIPPESQISTYAVMGQCNAVIIFATKTGVELASVGLPVIVAGEAWVRNKGITMDTTSPEDYDRTLDRLPLPERLTPAQTLRARMYAYHFFFRRMIPLEMFEPTYGSPPYRLQITGIKDLMPGKSRGLDVVCNGILNKTEFIYPSEKYSLSRLPV